MTYKKQQVPISFEFDHSELPVGYVIINGNDPGMNLFKHGYVLSPAYIDHDNNDIEIVGFGMIHASRAIKPKKNKKPKRYDLSFTKREMEIIIEAMGTFTRISRSRSAKEYNRTKRMGGPLQQKHDLFRTSKRKISQKLAGKD